GLDTCVSRPFLVLGPIFTRWREPSGGRAVANPARVGAVAAITGRVRESGAAVSTGDRGPRVGERQQRRGAPGAETPYAGVENTLTEIAAREAGIDAFEGKLEAPTAIAFIKGEPVEPAKALRDFAKKHDQRVIKSGYFEGNPLSEQDVKKLADLESREV